MHWLMEQIKQLVHKKNYYFLINLLNKDGHNLSIIITKHNDCSTTIIMAMSVDYHRNIIAVCIAHGCQACQ